jgi:hypothetical protein
MCASAVPVELVLVTTVSTTTLLTFRVPIEKFWTSECVVTVSVPSELMMVWLNPEAPVNGWAPPPA